MGSKQRIKTAQGSKKTGKILIISTAAIFLAIVALVIAAVILKSLGDKNDASDEIDYDFYPADFDENIYEDIEYTDLISDGFISYHNNSTNVTVGIDRDTAAQYGEGVSFIVETLYDVINGDHEKYNARFSKEYYEKNAPKGAFTMQKIYGVTITAVSEEKVSSDGENYTKFLFAVDYRILRNNGTFRRDIGEGSKTQYITVTDKSGALLIDSIATVSTISK